VEKKTRLGFLNRNDVLPLVGTAIQARVVGELELVALRTEREPWRDETGFGRPPLVSASA
jgi:hypothetical protein